MIVTFETKPNREGANTMREVNYKISKSNSRLNAAELVYLKPMRAR